MRAQFFGGTWKTTTLSVLLAASSLRTTASYVGATATTLSGRSLSCATQLPARIDDASSPFFGSMVYSGSVLWLVVTIRMVLTRQPVVKSGHGLSNQPPAPYGLRPARECQPNVSVSARIGDRPRCPETQKPPTAAEIHWRLALRLTCRGIRLQRADRQGRACARPCWSFGFCLLCLSSLTSTSTLASPSYLATTTFRVFPSSPLIPSPSLTKYTPGASARTSFAPGARSITLRPLASSR